MSYMCVFVVYRRSSPLDSIDYPNMDYASYTYLSASYSSQLTVCLRYLVSSHGLSLSLLSTPVHLLIVYRSTGACICCLLPVLCMSDIDNVPYIKMLISSNCVFIPIYCR